ncbi:hypothetical protein LZZ85_12165 [Terrimonas sp. NA20]|uniref:DUF7674 domain-containing protein n=1 Tax=Terrimonas ginsenosidimutans TaxID=2908004 RepID=A0ABS9KRW7_9BACT|nr:hypothetical protein [Terrimonas ginsenosidimutans]MCG2615044.1 hypothetical protein [Terrimonas ginsenosidimutans]
MITQYEASNLLKTKIPQLSARSYPSKVSLDVYACMNYFSDYTKKAVEEHNFSLAKKCFILAESLFREGDNVVKMLIENVFVYGFSSMLPDTKEERAFIRSIIPGKLYTLYTRQLSQSGC